jgi:hypothetical protein
LREKTGHQPHHALAPHARAGFAKRGISACYEIVSHWAQNLSYILMETGPIMVVDADVDPAQDLCCDRYCLTFYR